MIEPTIYEQIPPGVYPQDWALMDDFQRSWALSGDLAWMERTFGLPKGVEG